LLSKITAFVIQISWNILYSLPLRKLAFSINRNIIYLTRLGLAQENITTVMELDRSVVSRIVQNTKISEMHNLLSKGWDMTRPTTNKESKITPA